MARNASHDAHVPSLAARELACAVIKQAMIDALDPTTPADLRRDAEEFLAGDSWYSAWCETAGLQPVPLLSKRVA
jgi:hypothetical protein